MNLIIINLVQRYAHNLDKQDTENYKMKKVDNTLNKIRIDISTQKKSIQRLNDRVIGLEQTIQSNQSYLEQIKNLLTHADSKKGLIDRKLTTYIHILSRESPYLTTNVPRFFVNNKLVPWEVSIDLYDPPRVSFPAEYFKIDKMFVDGEISEDGGKEIVHNLDHTGSHLSVAFPPGVSSPSTPRFTIRQVSKGSLEQVKTRKNSQSSHQSAGDNKNQYMWNCSVEVEDPRNSSKKLFIDRKSWIAKIDEATSKVFPFIYSLDTSGYPKNPIGRTGNGEINKFWRQFIS